MHAKTRNVFASFGRRSKYKIIDLIRKNHRHPVIQYVARMSSSFLVAYWNQKNWDAAKNGELLILRALATYSATSSTPIIFDVGAHHGFYSLMAHEVLPDAQVHCFEIVPRTRDILRENLPDSGEFAISKFGLSSENAQVSIRYDESDDSQSRLTHPLYRDIGEAIECPVIRGDTYCAQAGVSNINLLKIDTEGHEIDVLKGFSRLIAEQRIDVIQFEYGTTWIPPRHFLYDAYELLQPAGFKIGRLYPDGVHFKSYDRVQDEHFRMGNYVAIHGEHHSLISKLNIQRSDV